MLDSAVLPKEGKALARVMRDYIAFEEARQHLRMIRYQLAWLYMQGQRRFEFRDLANRIVGSFAIDKEGKVPLVVPKLLTLANKVQGLIQGMDLWPEVTRRGDAMDTVRDKATTQVVLDSIVPEQQLDSVKKMYAWLVTMLGTAGIVGHITTSPTVGLVADLQAIHPTELFCFPSMGIDPTKNRGIVWRRKLPFTILKERYGQKAVDLLPEMYWGRRKFNTPPADAQMVVPFPGASGPVTVPITEDDYIEVRVWELWVEGIAGTCVRYAIGSGNVTIDDIPYDDNLYYCPIGVGRFWDCGNFYGIGIFEALFTLIREFERNIKDLINNVRDMDRYPIVALPAGTIHEKVAFKDVGRGMRYLAYQPEASYTGSAELRPVTIPMHNLGETPGRTAAYLEQLIEGMAPIRDIIKEKGRVDSYQGLQFLEEESARSQVVPIANTTAAWGHAWQAMARDALAELARSPQPLPVKRLDLALAGAVIDFEKGTMSFGKGTNLIPDISRLNFTVKEVAPRSKSVRKQEAVEYLTNQQTTVQEFKLLALKEGWDPAIYMEDTAAAYRTVVQNILQLYGDGQSPGPAVWLTPYTEKPDIQLLVLNSFMSSPEMRVASAAVVNEFIKYRESLLLFQGQVLPEFVPDPYDQAQQQALAQQQGMIPPSPAAPSENANATAA